MRWKGKLKNVHQKKVKTLTRVSFSIPRKKVSQMTKGKYEKCLEPEGLLKIEGWTKDYLTNEQITHNMHISGENLKIK